MATKRNIFGMNAIASSSRLYHPPPQHFLPLPSTALTSSVKSTSSRLPDVRHEGYLNVSRDLNGSMRRREVVVRTYASGSKGSGVNIPVIRSLAQLRRWRKAAREQGLEVGVVPTMGALHQGHLDLVKESLSKHPLTVLTLFVNPMQFAPTEDLSKYPRTLERDLDLLRTLLPSSSSSFPSSSTLRGLGVSENESFRPSAPAVSNNVRGLGVSENERPANVSSGKNLKGKGKETEGENGGSIGSGMDSRLIVFMPGEETMYPLRGNLQDLKQKKGVELDVKGWGDVMEGMSRPQFFKGVATVCTKLFNAVEPDHAYFGQKDIQQALLLKIMLTDLLISHPTADNLHILPTTRDQSTGLALSSRNAYLSPPELAVAPTLYQALSASKDLYDSITSENRDVTGEDLVSMATSSILEKQQKSLDSKDGVEVKLDYIEIFNKDTFEPIRGKIEKGQKAVIAGAIWVGMTRLIDNLLLGWGIEEGGSGGNR